MSVKKLVPWLNALAIALLAATLVQVAHESLHALVARLLGSRDIVLQLFAVSHVVSHDASGLTAAQSALIAGLPAPVNVLIGALGVLWFGRERRPLARLFAFYLAVFSLFSGFGYFMVDALMYSPTDLLGDYQNVIHFLGGGWLVRGLFLLLGAGGVLWTFFFVPRAAVRFAAEARDQAQRGVAAAQVLLVPYLVVCGLYLYLSRYHPVAELGFLIILSHYVFGYFGVFWGFFWATFWTQPKQPLTDATPLPADPAWRVVSGGLALTALILAAYLPGIPF